MSKPKVKAKSKLHPSEIDLSKTELKERSVLRSIFMRNRKLLIISVILSLVNEAIDLSIPVLMGYLVDLGILQQNLSLTIWGITLIITLKLLGNWLWSKTFIWTLTIRNIERHNLRVLLIYATLDPASKPVNRPAGEVLSISTTDADRAPDLADFFSWAVPAALAVLIAGLWLAYIHPFIGLIVFIGLVTQLVGIRFITPILSKKYDDQRSLTADAATSATDLVHGLRVLQGLGVQTRARHIYRLRSRRALSAAMISARYNGISGGFMSFIAGLLIAAIVVTAGILTLQEEITLGAFVAVAGLVRNMSGMMMGLADIPVWWSSFSTSARRIRQLLSEMGRSINEPQIRQVVANHQPGMDFEVHSMDDALRAPGIGDISTNTLGEIKESTLLAIVTEQSADAKLILSEFGELKPGRKKILLEPHAVDLFDGTVREQLATRAPLKTLRDPNDPDAWAIKALEHAGAADLLQILPDGLDTRIIDRGANLSGGQRQRLALARALAADNPVLVLHDPSTAVDAVTEQKIAAGIRSARAMPDRTTIMLTKSPALLAQADEVILVQNGEVLLRGKHSDLMTNSLYSGVVKR